MIKLIFSAIILHATYGGIIWQESPNNYHLTMYASPNQSIIIDTFMTYLNIANEATCVYNGIRASAIDITSNLQNIPVIDILLCPQSATTPCTNFLPNIPNSTQILNNYIMLNTTQITNTTTSSPPNHVKYIYTQLMTYYTFSLQPSSFSNTSIADIIFICTLSGTPCTINADCTSQSEDYCDIAYPPSLLPLKNGICNRMQSISTQISNATTNNDTHITIYRGGNSTENTHYQQIIADLIALSQAKFFSINTASMFPYPKFYPTQNFNTTVISMSYNYDGSLSANPPICYVDNLQQDSKFIDLSTYHYYSDNKFTAPISISNLLSVNNINKSFVTNYTPIYDMNDKPITTNNDATTVIIQFTNTLHDNVALLRSDFAPMTLSLSNKYYDNYNLCNPTKLSDPQDGGQNCILNPLTSLTFHYQKVCPPYNVYSAEVTTFTVNNISYYQAIYYADLNVETSTIFTTSLFAKYGASVYGNLDSQNAFDQIIAQQLFDTNIIAILPPYCTFSPTQIPQYVSYLNRNHIKLHIFSFTALNTCYEQLLQNTMTSVHIIDTSQSMSAIPLSRPIIDQYVDFITSINNKQVLYTVTANMQFMVQPATYDILHITSSNSLPPLYINSNRVAYPSNIASVSINSIHMFSAAITFNASNTITNTSIPYLATITGPYQYFDNSATATPFIIYYTTTKTIQSYTSLIRKTYNGTTPTYHIINIISPSYISAYTSLSSSSQLTLQLYQTFDTYYHYTTILSSPSDTTMYITYYDPSTNMYVITNYNYDYSLSNIDANNAYVAPTMPPVSPVSLINPIPITDIGITYTINIFSDNSYGGRWCDQHAFMYCYMFIILFGQLFATIFIGTCMLPCHGYYIINDTDDKSTGITAFGCAVIYLMITLPLIILVIVLSYGITNATVIISVKTKFGIYEYIVGYGITAMVCMLLVLILAVRGIYTKLLSVRIFWLRNAIVCEIAYIILAIFIPVIIIEAA